MKTFVWFTYKARIQAHTRLEWMDLHSQLLLVWYAVLAATLSVVTIRYPQALGGNTDILATILSIALLSVSLSVTNRDFRGRALGMQKTYRALQRLHGEIHDQLGPTPHQVTQYHDLLAASENHRDNDDLLFRVRVRGQFPLGDRAPGKVDIVHAYVLIAFRWLVTGFLYLAPLLVVWVLL